MIPMVPNAESTFIGASMPRFATLPIVFPAPHTSSNNFPSKESLEVTRSSSSVNLGTQSLTT